MRIRLIVLVAASCALALGVPFAMGAAAPGGAPDPVPAGPDQPPARLIPDTPPAKAAPAVAAPRAATGASRSTGSSSSASQSSSRRIAPAAPRRAAAAKPVARKRTAPPAATSAASSSASIPIAAATSPSDSGTRGPGMAVWLGLLAGGAALALLGAYRLVARQRHWRAGGTT